MNDLQDHPEEALHQLRVRMKKMEALLRLSRGAMGKKRREKLRAEIKAVKNAGGDQRDAMVLQKLAGELGRKQGLRLPETPLPLEKPRMRQIKTLMTRLQKDLSAQSFEKLSWEDIQENFEASYRTGRRLMREAEETQDPEAFHQWRKRVKVLHHQTGALEEYLPHVQKRLERSRDLGRLLGREQDLALLEEATQTPSPDRAWKRVIKANRDKVRPQALELGEKVYQRPASKFGRMRR
ncbi:CHAD domain-containing protein [Prosthecobacter fusiformis]|uniref:CHAD domain-containing protein n=1 Tax=Prosthecobacter fusiformis TaxID=48464 RepID=UPI00141518C1|nr:CHAD domain-containing protein [Prosthecobacter fusiformis]